MVADRRAVSLPSGQVYTNAMSRKVTTQQPAPRRTRDPDMRRAAILKAALAAFSEKGYARATVRDIALRAGVTHGLVQKHFGSKEQLFLAAVPGIRDWSAIVGPSDLDALPERIAQAFAERAEAGTDIDILVALLRSAASDIKAAKHLYVAVQAAATALYAPFLQGQDAGIRTDLLISLLIGTTFSRQVIGLGPLAELPTDEFKRVMADAFRQLLLPSEPQKASQSAQTRRSATR
jgi:AcrR family transcriptional regulator